MRLGVVSESEQVTRFDWVEVDGMLVDSDDDGV